MYLSIFIISVIFMIVFNSKYDLDILLTMGISVLKSLYLLNDLMYY